MKNSQRGFILPLLLVLVAVFLVGGAYVYMQNNKGAEPVVNQTAQPLSDAQKQKNDVNRVVGMDQVMKALAAYYGQNKSCPDSLSALIPVFINSLPVLPNQGEVYDYAITPDKFNCHLGVALEVSEPSLFYGTPRTGTAPWTGCNSLIANGCFGTSAINGFDGTNPKVYNKVVLKEKYGAIFISQQNSIVFSAIVTNSGFTNVQMDRGAFQSISPSNLSSLIKKGILYTTETTDFLQFNSSRPVGETSYLPLNKVKIDGYFDKAIGNGIITRVEQLKN